MKVLVACEYSGTVRDAFIARGHDAMSCDLLPTDKPGPHYQGDVLGIIKDGWDLIIAHPPCTALAVSGNRWYGAGMPKSQDRADSISWTMQAWDSMKTYSKRVCMGKPGRGSTRQANPIYPALAVWTRRNEEDRALASQPAKT